MNNTFHSVYTVNKRWIEKIFWMNVKPSQLFSSAMFPVVLFSLAWLLQAIWAKLICILAGLGLIVFFLAQVKKYAKSGFDSFSEPFGGFSEYQIETTIENDKIKYTLKHEGECLRTTSVSLAKCTQFTRYKEIIAAKETNTDNIVYFCGPSSRLQELAVFLEDQGLTQKSAKKNRLGKLASIGIIVISFVLAIYSFFPSSTDVVRYLDAWQKQGAYTSETNWTRNSLSELDSQISSVWTDGDTMYRIEQLEEKDGNSQIVVSSYADGKEKGIYLDAKGNVKRIDEKEVSRSEFFLDPIICPSEDAFLIDSSDTLERNPYFSWKKDGNKVVATLEDPDRFASYRVGKEEDSYTEEQLNRMDTIERMNLHYSGRIKPDHVDFAFVIQDKRIVEIVFDELVQITYPKAVEETAGTTRIHDLSVSSSVQEQVEALFEKPLRHGDVIDLP